MAISYAPRASKNAIAPGWVMTPMTADLMKDSPSGMTSLADIRWGGWPPDDIAAAAVFLASQEAAF